jgi:hypothetical protein
MATRDGNEADWVEVIGGALSFFGCALRSASYVLEGKKLQASGLATLAAGGAFAFFHGCTKLSKAVEKPSTAPQGTRDDGLYGNWEAEGISGTITIAGHDRGLHLLVPNSVGRFNVLSGGARSNIRGPFFVTTGLNSQRQQMLAMGQLSADNLIRTMTTTILDWDGAQPVFSDGGWLEFRRPRLALRRG